MFHEASRSCLAFERSSQKSLIASEDPVLGPPGSIAAGSNPFLGLLTQFPQGLYRFLARVLWRNRLNRDFFFSRAVFCGPRRVSALFLQIRNEAAFTE